MSVNYNKIKRNLIKRDTNLDSRFTSKVEIPRTKREPKYKDKDIQDELNG